jgi:hypothetical protein
MKVFFGILLSFVFFWTACSKAPEYPLEPQIQFKSITKSTMLQSLGNIFRDSLALTISFTDGDGDLGTPDVITNRPSDAFVIDATTGDTAQFFTMPYVAPKGAAKGINGEMKFVINTSCCDVPDAIKCIEKSVLYPSDTLNYKIIIVDRARNKSNELKLPPIVLICNQ